MKARTKNFLFPIEADPVKWAGRIVGSWTRFFIYAGLYSSVIYTLIMGVVERGAETAIYAVLLLIIFQLTLLYGLRWMYLLADKEQAD